MPTFKFILFEEHQITLEIEAETKEQAREIIEEDASKAKEIDRKSESELQDW